MHPRLRESAYHNICSSVSRVALPRGPAELPCGTAGRDLDVGVLRGRDAAGGGHVQREVTHRHRQYFGILEPLATLLNLSCFVPLSAFETASPSQWGCHICVPHRTARRRGQTTPRLLLPLCGLRLGGQQCQFRSGRCHRDATFSSLFMLCDVVGELSVYSI